MAADSPKVTALGYIGRGWSPIPVPAREKGPKVQGWPSLRVTADNVAQHFGVPGLNIGILLGEPSGWLVDVDLDAPEAIDLAPVFLPTTGAVFGRKGKPRSHWLYYARGAKKLDLRHGKTTVVELRSNGVQTVFPGSVHPSGEDIEWSENGEAATVSAEQLEQAVHMLAEAARLVRQGWGKEAACALAREGRVEKAPETQARTHVEGDFSEAVARYNTDHRREYPRSGGDCPGCGHKDCFGRTPNDATRWYCFSTSHEAPGLRGKNGYHGDSLDLDAHDRGVSRAELLRRTGYLSAYKKTDAPETKPPAEKEPAPRARFMSAAEYMDAWDALPKTVTIPTGIGALDGALGGGLPAHQITQIVGGPGSRKSELVRQIRNYCTAKGHPVLHVDAELTVGLLGTRDIAQEADIASAAVRNRDSWNDSQASSIATAQDRIRAIDNLWVMCTPPSTVGELDEAIRETLAAVKTDKPALLILDSLQQLSFGVEAKERRHEIERFIAWANTLAQKAGCAVLMTSERKRRTAQDEADALHSAAESRSVEYQAAVVLVLDAEGDAQDEIAGAARSAWEQRVRITVVKNREGQKGKLPDALVFTGPSWGFKVEPAEDELADAVVAELRNGPRGSFDISKALKKRRYAIDSVLQWLVDQSVVERLRITGKEHKVVFRLADGN